MMEGKTKIEVAEADSVSDSSTLEASMPEMLKLGAVDTKVPSQKSADSKTDRKHLVLESALRRNRIEERHIFRDRIDFVAVQDHILPSICRHVDGETCQVCRFEKDLGLPHLPEMIFPQNRLTLFHRGRRFIEFNAFDALRRVDNQQLPDVKVGPSSAWQSARQETLLPLEANKDVQQQPFDWTYTSDYTGTLGENVRVEVADPGTAIDYERLKRKDPIQFYSQMALYEDELADNGCAQMMIRVRVMPDTFFVLCRFYLRVDHVMCRICDTRLYGEAENENFAVREFSQREAKFLQLDKQVLAIDDGWGFPWKNVHFQALDCVLDPSLLFAHLPVVVSRTEKIFYP